MERRRTKEARKEGRVVAGGPTGPESKGKHECPAVIGVTGGHLAQPWTATNKDFPLFR